MAGWECSDAEASSAPRYSRETGLCREGAQVVTLAWCSPRGLTMTESAKVVEAKEAGVRIKVSWLKQKVDETTNQPLLEFDEQQYSTFEPRSTTFRMVKHACSYPAPPHKVRMWCSSLGAQPDLPSVMDLNMFINTFELITEERHTLEMAHLTGGETIAFEMVQSDQMSELSGFLLGNTKAGLKGPVLSDATQHQKSGEEKGVFNVRVSKEEVAKAEEERSRLADELIAEEEEEVRLSPYGFGGVGVPRRRAGSPGSARGSPRRDCCRDCRARVVGNVRRARHTFDGWRVSPRAAYRCSSAAACPRARPRARVCAA